MQRLAGLSQDEDLSRLHPLKPSPETWAAARFASELHSSLSEPELSASLEGFLNAVTFGLVSKSLISLQKIVASPLVA
jgi:hypothetical protein